MVKRGEQKKAGLRFAGLYLLSLALLFVVITAFWKQQKPETQEAEPVAADTESFAQIDSWLHTRMNQMDSAYFIFLKTGRQANSKEASILYSSRNAVAVALDSIQKLASFLSDGPKKQMMENTVAGFRSAFETRATLISMMSDLPVLHSNPSPDSGQTTTAANGEVTQLKTSLAAKDQEIALLRQQINTMPTNTNPNDAQLKKDLAQRDQTILSLQNQLRTAQSNSNKPAANDGEWKQKYASLKQAYDKTAESEKSLRNAYKTVAEDNRRLLNQLQTLRKG